MPGGDKTGPLGKGPMSGRGLGFCKGNEEPGFIAPNRFGFGRGRGWRFGWRDKSGFRFRGGSNSPE